MGTGLTDYEREEQFYDLLQELSMYNSVFLALWRVGVPNFTTDPQIPRAAVLFDREGRCLDFRFDRDFWDSIDPYTRMFVVCHECLHIILNHGTRGRGTDPDLANIAMDIAVNHLLVHTFGFVREDIIDHSNYCWVDTVFEQLLMAGTAIPVTGNFEYYYNLLITNTYTVKLIVDSHNVGEDGENSLPTDIQSNIDIASGLTQSEANKLNEVRDEQGGQGHVGEPLVPGCFNYTFKNEKISPSPFWASILDDLEHDIKYEYSQQFVTRSRRFTLLDKKFMLPGEYEVEKRALDKPSIYLYIDCSGSCHSLKNDFFRLSQTIDPRRFNVKLFARTTVVVPLVKKKGQWEVPGGCGGSDDWNCIEAHVQKDLKIGALNRHPTVIHFTDGYDCAYKRVKPAMPEKWVWVISTSSAGYMHTQLIPPTCKRIYNFKDVVGGK